MIIIQNAYVLLVLSQTVQQPIDIMTRHDGRHVQLRLHANNLGVGEKAQAHLLELPVSRCLKRKRKSQTTA